MKQLLKWLLCLQISMSLWFIHWDRSSVAAKGSCEMNSLTVSQYTFFLFFLKLFNFPAALVTFRYNSEAVN